MRAVSDMPKEKSTEASIMEQMNHQEMLNFIRTVKLPYKLNKMLNITVEEEYERRENDETRIDLYLQILRGCNLPGPELEMKVLDAGYASLYDYNSLSAEDHTGTSFTQEKRANQVILVTFRSIRQGYPARNTAGHTKEQNSIWQERINTALTNFERLIPKRNILDDDVDLPELVHDDSSVESDSGYSNNGSASTRFHDEEDIQTAENVNDETEHGYSSIDEEDKRAAGSNKKAKS